MLVIYGGLNTLGSFKYVNLSEKMIDCAKANVTFS